MIKWFIEEKCIPSGDFSLSTTLQKGGGGE
jgi:hypothetical protein